MAMVCAYTEKTLSALRKLGIFLSDARNDGVGLASY